MSPALQNFDVMVVGGGSAGIAAAVGAARKGAKVGLLERNSFLGGMGTAAYVGTICGLYHRSSSTARFLPNPFAEEFAQKLMRKDSSKPTCYAEGLWFVPYERESFVQIAQEFLSKESVSVFYGTALTEACVLSGKVNELTVFCHGTSQHLAAKAFIDASGFGALAELCHAPFLSGVARQAGALSFEVSGIFPGDPANFPKLVAKELLRGMSNKVIPEVAARVTMVPGSLRPLPDSAHVPGSYKALFKLALPEVMELQDENAAPLYEKATHRAATAVQYLSSHCNEFRGAALSLVASQVGIRTGPRAEGESTLTEAMVLGAQKPDSSVAWAAWPIEIWGKERGPRMTYLPEGETYGIPSGCLKVKTLENVWTAGRGISADDGAIASARVMGTCLATGFAAGELAAS